MGKFSSIYFCNKCGWVVQKSPLTLREIAVLRGYADGLRTTEIASNLCISVKTVESHRQSLLLKVMAKTIGQAVAWAIKIGLVQFDILTLEVLYDERKQEEI